MRAMMITTGRAEDLKGATSLLQIGRNRIQPRPDLRLREPAAADHHARAARDVRHVLQWSCLMVNGSSKGSVRKGRRAQCVVDGEERHD